MSPWINYHHLFYFKTIAEEGGVSKAAKKLKIGQPTLSAQLKLFEETLGIKLFERDHKKLTLSEQGKVALDYARSIFKLGSEMYEVLQDRITPQRHALCIGALDSIPKQIVLQLVKGAFKLAPCQITLLEGRPEDLLRELAAHRVDLVISNFLPNVLSAQKLYHRRITKNPVAVYGAPKFKAFRKNYPESIQGLPVVLPTYDSKLRSDIDQWQKRSGVALDVITESQDIAIKKLLAVEGLGLIPTAPHAISQQLARGELIKIGPLQGVYEELILVAAQRRIENPIAARLWQSFSVSL